MAMESIKIVRLKYPIKRQVILHGEKAWVFIALGGYQFKINFINDCLAGAAAIGRSSDEWTEIHEQIKIQKS